MPYARRADYLLDADVGVSLHLDHIETAYSFRTRILDYLWAGLPILATSGDCSRPPSSSGGSEWWYLRGGPGGRGPALLTLSDERTREAMGDQARATAQELTWNRCAAPLVKFCAHPALAPDRQVGYSPTRPGADRPRAGLGPVRKVAASLRQGGPAQLARDVRAYIAWRLGR